MTRALLLAAAFASAAAAGVAPPVPRFPDAALAPLEKAQADAANPDDPAKIADRIARNAKAAGDRLEGQDVGDATRKTQADILRDLDALLKNAENPPPMSGGGGGNSDQPPPMGGGNSDQPPPMPTGGSGQPMPMSGGQSGSQGNQPDKQPMGGGGQQHSQGGGGQPKPQRGSWRERLGQAKPQPAGAGQGDPMPTGAKPMGDPMPAGPGGQVGKASDPMNPNGTGTGNPTTSPPAPPLDDALTKQVWGHLPERLRQQMTQYYRDQFMPQYADQLRDYFTALADRDKAPRR